MSSQSLESFSFFVAAKPHERPKTKVENKIVISFFLCVFHNNYYKVKDELMKWGKRLISFFSCLYINIFVKLFPCKKSKFSKIN